MENKFIGIWMDHASAYLMECSKDTMETQTIESDFTHDEKEASLQSGEKTMHHTEHREQLAYYKQIAAVIKNYKKVLLFGPTHAKTELLNMLKEDHHFDNIKIESRQADKMTENQQHAFVRDYFFHHEVARN